MPLRHRAYMNTAEAEIPQGGEGMLVTQGGRSGGWPHLHSTARAASAGSRISVLKVDGNVVASEKMDCTVPLVLQWDETFDVGTDTGTPVDNKN
jgi:hypothetical protein